MHLFNIKSVACRWAALVSFALLAGCGSPPLNADLRYHVVAVNEWGEPVNPGMQLAKYADTQAFDQQLDDLFAHLRGWLDDPAAPAQHNRRKVFIFVHGGMVSATDALTSANTDYKQICRDGSYPIFINWDSAPLNSYFQHLFFLRQGLRETANPLDITACLISDLGRAISRYPEVWGTMITHDVSLGSAALSAQLKGNQDLRFTADPEEKDVVAVTQLLHQENHLDLKFGNYIGHDGISYLEATEFLAFYPVKLLLGPPLDALGKPAWDTMSRRTAVLFDGKITNEPNDQYVDPVSIVHAGDGPLVRFITQLRKLQREYPDVQITLVGHSMGSIVLNEMVRRSTGRVHYDTIVYMAAAASVRDWQRCVIPYLAAQHPVPSTAPSTTQPALTQFYNLTLHPVDDLRDNEYYDLIPRGSLPVWIDDFLANPVTPFDRTLGRWDNITKAVTVIPSNLQSQIHLKVFSFSQNERDKQLKDARTGQRMDNPQMHGQFTQVRYWDPTLWTSPPPLGDGDIWELIDKRKTELEHTAK